MLMLAAIAPFAAWVAVSLANSVVINEAAPRPAPASHLYVLGFATLAILAIAAAANAIAAIEALLLISALCFFAAFDRRFLAVPVAPLLALIVVGLAFGALESAQALAFRAGAAFIGWVAMRSLAFAYRCTRGSVGLGEGDALLAAALGAWLSFEGLAWSIGLGCAAALLWMRIRKIEHTQHVALAPGLGVGAGMFLVAAPLLGAL
jgi:prepilin signal peptidase PulO-like enzyme (type II secretory pathway)